MNIRTTGHHITQRIRLIACIGALGTGFRRLTCVGAAVRFLSSLLEVRRRAAA
jgi:hypothetical protein